ncbi:hypothetical protein ASG29_04435 [Sphingomonas sp. Leaf412]|uniref:energy transducer TonB n=1 Tax=Sphingomonas sp. Leaf412 TaxID=1736370 RepID=UPI0007253BA9|nr:energy transducer TonB [Sphingomonas sp. Leaf412]KQT33317.1 hypothetical protein ASG29_04435 [Sphingomonas sp. Leaf412]
MLIVEHGASLWSAGGQVRAWWLDDGNAPTIAVAVPTAYLPDWIGPQDYPEAAKAARLEGTVELSWNVARDGRIDSCRIDRSSGHPILDQATCRLLIERGWFRVVSANGPRLRHFSSSYRWKLPPAGTAIPVPATGA